MKERKNKVDGSHSPKLSKKIIKQDSQEVHIQYPAKVGYHGTDAEKELNPEE